MTRPVRVAFAPVVAAVCLALAGCSLLLRADDQCTDDGDCARFGPGVVCQRGTCGASVAPASTLPLNPPGCTSGSPEDVRKACTDARCLPFDNCARLGLCSDAALPALVPPPVH